MSEFERRVLAVVGRLGPGELVTYGEVAEQAGFPGAARAGGTLLRRTEEDVPWWRVIAANGRLSTRPSAGQAQLLEGEGVTVRDRRVRLGNQ